MNVILNLIQDLIGKQKGPSSVRFRIKSGMTYSLSGILLLTHSHKTDTLTLSSSARAAQNGGGKVVCYSDESQNLIVERTSLCNGEILKLVQNDIKNKNCNNESQFTNHYSLNNDGLLRTARNDEKRNHLSTYSPINLSTCKKKAAFTLAEVLITLGIIGVVAAMTIPGLINNYKAHRFRAQFLKSYSTVQQVIKHMEADEVSLDPSTYASGTFYKAFAQYITGAHLCSQTSNTSPLPCYSSVNGKYPYKTLDGKINISKTILDDGAIALQDGSLLMFENYNSGIYVSVDLNGFNNLPNRWGYDLFTFQFVDGELVTMGDKKSKYTDLEKYCNPNISNDMNGIACAQKAKSNSDYFKQVVKNK